MLLSILSNIFRRFYVLAYNSHRLQYLWADGHNSIMHINIYIIEIEREIKKEIFVLFYVLVKLLLSIWTSSTRDLHRREWIFGRLRDCTKNFAGRKIANKFVEIWLELNFKRFNEKKTWNLILLLIKKKDKRKATKKNQ